MGYLSLESLGGRRLHNPKDLIRDTIQTQGETTAAYFQQASFFSSIELSFMYSDV